MLDCSEVMYALGMVRFLLASKYSHRALFRSQLSHRGRPVSHLVFLYQISDL